MPKADPSLSVAERVDAACDEFEREWRSGRRPNVDDFVDAAPETDRDALRSALLAVETELQAGREAGDTSVSAESVRTGSHHGPGPTVARPSDQTSVPRRVGRFEIRALLGSGAFGRVYRAYDPSLDREVALKVPVGDAVRAPVDRDRFVKEAKAAATVSHPNVCQIFEVGEHEGQPYIVMALVPGQSLAEVLRARKEPLPEKQAAIIVRKLALALEAAHKKGVVHRDLKPANVMFDKERKDLVVMDFGLARRPTSGGARDTQSGVVMGTPAYMSPEQARGDAKDVGPAGDIFSLGIILYELLAGSRPFGGTAHEVIGQILLIDPEPPSQLRPGVNPVLEAACLKALAKDPAKRFASMKEFAAAVDVYLRQPASSTAETARAVETKPDTENTDGAGLSTDTRKLAEVFEEMSVQRKKAQAETEEAVEEAAARHGVPRWALYLVLGLLGLMLLGGGAFAIYTLTKKKEDPPVANTPKVKLQLKGLDLSDKTLSYKLDGKPITAAELEQEIDLAPGDHELCVYKGDRMVRRFKLKVGGGDDPTVELEEVEIPEPKVVPPVVPKVELEPDFVPIFNGKDLDGWEAKTRPEAFGVDPQGNLTARGDTPAGRQHWLLTKKEYSDYVLRFEVQFTVAAGANSGIAIRSQPDGLAVRPQRLNVELRNVDRGLPKVGALVYTANDAVEPKNPIGGLGTGEWHKVEIEVRGTQVKVTIKEKVVNDVDMTKIDRTLLAKVEKWAEADLDRKKGHIGIQSQRNPVKFRNIRVKDLAAPPRGPALEPPVVGNPLLRRWTGHNKGVTGVWYSPDGWQVVSSQVAHPRYEPVLGCSDRVWSPDSDKPLDVVVTPRRSPEHDRGIRYAAFSRDGRFVLMGCVDVTDAVLGHYGKPTLVLRDHETGEVLKDLKLSDDGHMAITGADLTADGKLALACLGDGTARVFETTDWKEVRRAEGSLGRFTPDGKHFLTTKGNDLFLWTATGEGPETRRVKGNQAVGHLCWFPDGRHALVCGPNGASAWDVETGKEVLVLKGHTGGAAAGAVSPNGKYIVTGGADKTARLWDVSTGLELYRYEDHEGPVTSVAFSPGSGRIVTGCADQRVRLWAVPADLKLPVVPKPPDMPMVVLPPIGPSEGVKGLAPLHLLLPNKEKMNATDAMFSSDGTMIFTACRGGEAKAGSVIPWDAKTGRQKGAAATVTDVTRIAFGGNKFVFFVDGNATRGTMPELVVWSSGKGASELTFPFDKRQGYSRSLEVDRDGKTVLATRADGPDFITTAIFDLANGQTRFTTAGLCSCFVPEPGKNAITILVGDKTELKQIDIASEKVIRTLKKHVDAIQYVACSPDGRFAVTSSTNSTGTASELILWDLKAPDGNPILLDIGKKYVLCFAFSPGGRTLLTGNEEGVLKLWDVVERKEVFAVRGDKVRINSVKFSPDGSHAVTGGSEEGAKVWKVVK